jgi:hypothetical protein
LAAHALIGECIKHSVLVARMAMLYGIKPNLLRIWIEKSDQTPSWHAASLPAKRLEPSPAFFAVKVTASPENLGRVRKV